MAAYRRVYDSRHLQGAKNRDQLWNLTLGNRVWATFTFFVAGQFSCSMFVVSLTSRCKNDSQLDLHC